MSQRVPGYGQPEMIAPWKQFVQQTFRRTNFRTTFNGKERPVYRDGVARLIVLDEWHGDLEVLTFQTRPGKAQNIGSQEIDLVMEPPGSGGRPKVKAVKLGTYHAGGKHQFVLVGNL